MNQYLPLKTKSAALGDDYYRCLSETLTRPHTRETIDECLRLARRYRTALRRQLKDLERLSDQRFVIRERELIQKYLDLVERDIRSLDQEQINKLLRRRRKPTDQ
jgi:hypothetical protein